MVENGEIKIGWPLCVKATISVDHRVSDGVEAAQRAGPGEVFGGAAEVVRVRK